MSTKKAMNGFYVLGCGTFIKRVGDELEIEVHGDGAEAYGSRHRGARVPYQRLIDLFQELAPQVYLAENSDAPIGVDRRELNSLRVSSVQQLETIERLRAEVVGLKETKRDAATQLKNQREEVQKELETTPETTPQKRK